MAATEGIADSRIGNLPGPIQAMTEGAMLLPVLAHLSVHFRESRNATNRLAECTTRQLPTPSTEPGAADSTSA